MLTNEKTSTREDYAKKISSCRDDFMHLKEFLNTWERKCLAETEVLQFGQSWQTQVKAQEKSNAFLPFLPEKANSKTPKRSPCVSICVEQELYKTFDSYSHAEKCQAIFIKRYWTESELYRNLKEHQKGKPLKPSFLQDENKFLLF